MSAQASACLCRLPCPSCTAVDIEERLYRHAASLGITLVTITQVGGSVSVCGWMDGVLVGGAAGASAEEGVAGCWLLPCSSGIRLCWMSSELKHPPAPAPTPTPAAAPLPPPCPPTHTHAHTTGHTHSVLH